MHPRPLEWMAGGLRGTMHPRSLEWMAGGLRGTLHSLAHTFVVDGGGITGPVLCMGWTFILCSVMVLVQCWKHWKFYGQAKGHTLVFSYKNTALKQVLIVCFLYLELASIPING